MSVLVPCLNGNLKTCTYIGLHGKKYKSQQNKLIYSSFAQKCFQCHTFHLYDYPKHHSMSVPDTCVFVAPLETSHFTAAFFTARHCYLSLLNLQRLRKMTKNLILTLQYQMAKSNFLISRYITLDFVVIHFRVTGKNKILIHLRNQHHKPQPPYVYPKQPLNIHHARHLCLDYNP